MGLASCPKCWDTPCRCGHEYEDWNVKDLDDQIVMLQRVRAGKEPRVDPAPTHLNILVGM